MGGQSAARLLAVSSRIKVVVNLDGSYNPKTPAKPIGRPLMMIGNPRQQPAAVPMRRCGAGSHSPPFPARMQQFAGPRALRGEGRRKAKQVEADPRFAGFVAERGDALLRYGYVLAGNPHDAADLVQEALLKLRAAWPRIRAKDNPESYVRTVMARSHIATWRLRRHEVLAWDLPERGYQDALADGDEQAMWVALAGLPRKQRAVLVLRYYEGLSDVEIAATLGISRGTVRSQASRALGKLRDAAPAGVREDVWTEQGGRR
ncbi:hypothetical protein Misp01_52740 [Microtetraspora sp. NBRC 13810]|uniref:SigE family RNA polymerase sigma factor n=1 Tax=Microtetraspora sp. NBRC 13810 TaxID=3030990 RepID=UPI002555732E|nr:SigE family RNA polymerase sigma factor [Microtetraspora sp. NBRC 13810]GLW10145.1 hypothetical protein Misp01_52740 [Microtetraspora sp. NBRC 13810]